MSSRSRPKGAWAAYPTFFDPDLDAEMTWGQIFAKVDELLGGPKARRHRFPGASKKVRVIEKPEILPHGARRFRFQWPEA